MIFCHFLSPHLPSARALSIVHPPSLFRQTGGGKTHTLQGDLQEQDGLLPRSCRMLMEILREKVKGALSELFTVLVSVLLLVVLVFSTLYSMASSTHFLIYVFLPFS